jgi:hypothetical protein
MKTVMRFLITTSMYLLLSAINISARPFIHISFDAYAPPAWISFVGVHNDSNADYIVSGHLLHRNALYGDMYIAARSSATFSWPVVVSSSDDRDAHLSVAQAPRSFWDAFAGDYTTIYPNFNEGLVFVEQRAGLFAEYNDYSFYSGTRFWIVIYSDHCVGLEYE